MKIIKKPEKLPIVQCKYCKAILKIKYKDIDFYDYSKYLVCPICKECIRFDEIEEIAYKEEEDAEN